MKKKGLIIGVIVLALIILGIIAMRVINDNSLKTDDEPAEEVIELASLLKEHCYDEVCIKNLVIKKSIYSEVKGHYIDFEMDYQGKAKLNNVKLEFVFTTDNGEVKVIQPEAMTIEKDSSYGYSIDVENDDIENARSYDFTYTVNN